MVLLALALAQVLDVSAGQLPAPPPSFPYTSNAGIDIGCIGGGAQGSRFPAHAYDPARRETIIYNVSRCTGGFIRATEDSTGKSWNIEISPTGGLAGHDLNGDAWRYDRVGRRYFNTISGTSCTKPDYRAMCGARTSG